MKSLRKILGLGAVMAVLAGPALAQPYYGYDHGYDHHDDGWYRHEQHEAWWRARERHEAWRHATHEDRYYDRGY